MNIYIDIENLIEVNPVHRVKFESLYHTSFDAFFEHKIFNALENVDTIISKAREADQIWFHTDFLEREGSLRLLMKLCGMALAERWEHKLAVNLYDRPGGETPLVTEIFTVLKRQNILYLTIRQLSPAQFNALTQL